MKRSTFSAYGAILLTFATGILVGVLGTGWYVRDQIDKWAAFTTQQGMVAYYEQMLEPIPADKRQAVDTILNRHATVLARQFSEHRQILKTETNAMMEDLSEVLTPDQMAKLTANREHWQKRFKKFER